MDKSYLEGRGLPLALYRYRKHLSLEGKAKRVTFGLAVLTRCSGGEIVMFPVFDEVVRLLHGQ